jgi:hypothetical protein
MPVDTLDPWPMVDQNSKTISFESTGYRISGGRAKKLKIKDPSDEPQFGYCVNPVDGTEFAANLAAHGKSPSYWLEWKSGSSGGDAGGNFNLKVKRGKISKVFTLGEDTVSWAMADGPSKLFAATDLRFRKYACDSTLYRIDFSTGAANPLVTDAGNLKVDVKRSVWLGTQTDSRPLETLQDGRSVYVSSLYGGNWDVNRRWTIAEGLVFVSQYQFRPPN